MIFFPNIVFGSLSGTFILAYVILWMVLPEARSPYEKMEMRGEKVDVNTIRQNVQEGDKDKWGEEVKSAPKNFSTKAKEFADTKGKTFAREVGETAPAVVDLVMQLEYCLKYSFYSSLVQSLLVYLLH